VKTVVCVRNPGPTAEVAIRKAAPSKVLEVLLATVKIFCHKYAAGRL